MPEGSAPSSQIAQFRSDGFTGTTGLRIPFFSESFSRSYGMPETRLVNMISEATPHREERPYVAFVGLREVHYSRPALVARFNHGAGPIRAVVQAPPGLAGGGLIIVSGNIAYDQNGGDLGAIPGGDIVRFAASSMQIVAVSEGNAYLFDSTTGGVFVPFPQTASWKTNASALPPVIDVAFLDGTFIYQLAASGTFFYSQINDAANIPGLNFATAEAYADNTVGLAVLNDQLLIFGSQSVETWSPSTDPNAPFQPVEGRGYQRGCAARGSIAYVDNAIFWVGDNRVVYRSENVPTSISSDSLNDKLRQCANIAGLTSWAATFDGHEFYVLNIPGVGTYAYDCSRVGTLEGSYGDSYSRGEWDEWQSHGREVFRGQVGLCSNGITYVGDDTTNDVGVMTAGVYQDYGAPLVRVASAFIKIEEGTPRCTGIVLHCVLGVGNPTPPGVNPVVEMRYSDDQGRTFGKWRAAPLQAQGNYKARVHWNRLGLLRAPGRLVEVRVSDPVNCVFSHLELNPMRAAY
jgi:hypothetical protein